MTEGHFIVLIIGIILVAGCLGGAVNYLLSRKTIPDAMDFWPSIIVGIGAAFLVPLFLNMASSDLLDQIRPEQGAPDFSKALIFAGFCLLASMSSRAFIKTLADRLMREVTEAKRGVTEAKREVTEAKQKASAAEEKAAFAEQRAIGAEERANQVKSEVEPIVAGQTEQDTPPEAPALMGKTQPELSANERTVLEVLAAGRLTLRTRTGIARDSSLPREIVVQLVEELKNKGLMSSTEITKRDGTKKTRWYITPEGRSAVSVETKA